MDHADIKRLIEKAITPGPAVWADLGSGEGAFTLALAELLGPKATIYSVDKNARSLRTQKELFEKQFPNMDIKFIEADFTEVEELPSLDGILMANSLHFVKKQVEFLTQLRKILKPNGKLVLVEYDKDGWGPYVPFPLSFKKLGGLVKEAGFAEPTLLATAPSRYQGKMYGAKVKLKQIDIPIIFRV